MWRCWSLILNLSIFSSATQSLADMPTKAEVLAAIPEHCFKKDTMKSLMYAAISAALTIGTL